MRFYFVLLVVFCYCFSLFSEPVYEEFIVNGEKVNKWVNLILDEKYDVQERIVYHKSEYGTFMRIYIENGGWNEYDQSGNLKSSYVCNRNGKPLHYNTKGMEEFYKYDEKDNLIYKKTVLKIYGDTLYEEWNEFNANGKKLHSKKSDGYEEWHKYDSNGNEIYYKNTDGKEISTQFDLKGNLVYCSDWDGHEIWIEYSEDGCFIENTELSEFKGWSKIKVKSLDDKSEFYYGYDSKEKTIECRTSDKIAKFDLYNRQIYDSDWDGHEIWIEYSEDGCCFEDSVFSEFKGWSKIKINKNNKIAFCEYDSNERIIKANLPEGEEGFKLTFVSLGDSITLDYWGDTIEYDNKGRLIHRKNADGFERWVKYDKNGNKIYEKDTQGFEEEYDSQKNIIYLRKVDGTETFTKYEYWDNGKIRKKSVFKPI